MKITTNTDKRRPVIARVDTATEHHIVKDGVIIQKIKRGPGSKARAIKAAEAQR